MNEFNGAIQTNRHSQGSQFTFCDGHVKWLRYRQTYNLPAINLHRPY
jgi:prepilin-type processing-associated H-X9-DG protein